MNDTQIRALKPREKSYRVADGGGLYVQIEPSGGKLWRLAYRHLGKQKTLAIGRYPEVGLQEARARRDDAKRLLSDGIDPAENRKAEKRKAELAANTTFGSVAKAWYAVQKTRWVESYASRIWGRIEDDLLPDLGERPINTITPLEMLDVLRKIEDRGAVESAKRIKQYASHIFQYGVILSMCERDPTRDIGRALKPLRGTQKRRNSLPAAELSEFMKRLREHPCDDAVKAAIRLAVLTFVRTSEIRFARKEEFDLDNAIWRIPAERMKMNRPHLVPLAPAVVDIVRGLPDGMLFPAMVGKRESMSENTMLFVLYRMGYKGRATIHGFRATASTALNEAGWNRDWVERQLAHAEDDAIRAAYNAAEWLPGRRKMMEAWANFVEHGTPLTPQQIVE